MKARVRLLATVFLWAWAWHVVAAETGVALDALQAAAARGDAKAQTELALRYEHAEGVARDYVRARVLYCDAAKKGDAEAQFQLGWMYANGRGVPHDDGIAAELFAVAAAQGHTQAARLLRYVHPQGTTELPRCVLSEESAEISNADVARTALRRSEFERLVHRLAPQYAVDPRLALAVISAESAFDASAVSPKDARGLMQLTAATASRFGVKSVLDPVDNVKGGLAYLRWLLAYFEGDVRLVLAAYNAGEDAVERYNGVPPYAETREYIRRIASVYKKTHLPFVSGIVQPSPLMRRNRAGNDARD